MHHHATCTPDIVVSGDFTYKKNIHIIALVIVLWESMKCFHSELVKQCSFLEKVCFLRGRGSSWWTCTRTSRCPGGTRTDGKVLKIGGPTGLAQVEVLFPYCIYCKKRNLVCFLVTLSVEDRSSSSSLCQEASVETEDPTHLKWDRRALWIRDS